MELTTPLDSALRARLRKAKPHQTEFAQAIGRSPAWLNKYMHGTGHATLDDAVRILALLIGVDQPQITVLERRVLKALRSVPEERREDAAYVMEIAAKGYLHGRYPISVVQVNRTPAATNRRAREKRRGDAASVTPRK